MTRKAGLTLALVLLVSVVAAQDFVFVSNRLRAGSGVDSAGTQLQQNELFRYLDGSEIRLTFTPDQDEWAPSPSPSGRYLAYLVNDTVADWYAEDAPESWNWLLRIMDLESGLLVEEWHLTEASGIMLNAGDFDIVWHEDEQSLLVQQIDHANDRSIFLVEVGTPEPQFVSRGSGIHLDPERGWIATYLDGYATVIDPFSGNSYPLMMGEPLAWLGDRLVVGGHGPLVLIEPVTAEQTRIAAPGDLHGAFVSSPDGSRHAWMKFSMDGGMTEVTVTDAEFNVLNEWLHDGYVGDVLWLEPDSLLITGLAENRLTINALQMADGSEYVLVGTLSDNLQPAMLPVMPEGAP